MCRRYTFVEVIDRAQSTNCGGVFFNNLRAIVRCDINSRLIRRLTELKQRPLVHTLLRIWTDARIASVGFGLI